MKNEIITKILKKSIQLVGCSLIITSFQINCQGQISKRSDIEVYVSSQYGDRLTKKADVQFTADKESSMSVIKVDEGIRFQISNTTFAQKIYLSPIGNDSNPGTIDKPIASLNAARDRAREFRKINTINQPIEVIVQEGEYTMTEPLLLTIDDAASSAYPLIFKAENGKKATFFGGVKVTGLEKVNDTLWRAFIPDVACCNWYFEQLYVNGTRAIRAKTPNEDFYFINKMTETVVEKGKGQVGELAIQKIVLDSMDGKCFQSFSPQDFQDAVITFYHKWDNTIKHIFCYNQEQSSIFTIGTGMHPWNSLDNQSRYTVENFRAALDAPGEWFLERSGTLYYIPRKGETIENTTIYAPRLNDFIIIKGDETTGKYVENICFENLDFQVAGYQMPDLGIEAAQAAWPVQAVVMAEYARNIQFLNCEISHTGTNAIWFRKACSDCSITHCYFHDLGAGGIKIGDIIIPANQKDLTRNIMVDNNIIHSGGFVFPCAVGITIFHASDNSVTHNEIADFRYSGISVGWVWGYNFSPSKRNIIEYNSIHHLGWGELCDMGGIYTLGASEGTVIANNVIYNVYSFDYGGWGLYTDEGSFGITMENNLVYACKNSGFHQHYGKENIIRNNIFACNMRAQLQATRIEEHQSFQFTNNIIYFEEGNLLSNNWNKINILSDYNCYWDKRTKNISFGHLSFNDWKNQGKDNHSIIADPMFENPDEFDFKFRSLSIARKIKFKPFDYLKSGVYGSAEWEKLAVLNPDICLKYNKRVGILEKKHKMEKINDISLP